MGFELLLDENVEHDVLYKLQARGHDVEHVEFVETLGKGATDTAVAEYSLDTGRVVLSYDDDFRDDFSSTEFFGFIFMPDGTLSSEQVARIVDEMNEHYRQQDLRGVHVLDNAWL